MTKIIERIKAQYDTVEVPFGRSYRWHQAHIVLECDCGEKPTFKMSALTGSRAVCACGVDLTADIQEKLLGHQPEVQGQMLEGYEATHHPWLHDPRAQAEQHLRDEAAYPEDSPWRYNDVTSGLMEDDEECWQKAREQQRLHSSYGHQSLSSREELP